MCERGGDAREPTGHPVTSEWNMPMAKTTEQRRFVRLPFRRKATLEGPEGTVEATLEDISLNGVRLKLHGERPGPEEGRYRLAVELAPGSTVRMELSMVHRQNETAGFRCRRMDKGSLASLKRLLALYYGDGSEQMNAEVNRLYEMIRKNTNDPPSQHEAVAENESATR